MKNILFLLSFLFAINLNAQHITDFFDSIPGLQEKYNLFLSKNGEPDSIHWFKDGVNNYINGPDQPPTLTDGFAIYYDNGKIHTLTHRKEPTREYIYPLFYPANRIHYFRLQWRDELPTAIKLLFGDGVDKQWDQFIGQPLEKELNDSNYNVTIVKFRDPKRLEQLLKILDALHFKYTVE